eukprot:CAMPEP_0176403090 /NCGR_PEP_ID=MMETSP0126-20121128/49814_1 /TAXON_ID=141414 ORGANISM="Strombidinopsis acuminatum, Strain SPMC142" /NCGR_SAMPLE_ID=MMETSP0126 /ASSEMBLY_ACC=CAM_ASM_000229 /LENGTH=37 /DNA_ID= /DNA_START= /DNA_END= /DNA_ORIENTATION=
MDESDNDDVSDDLTPARHVNNQIKAEINAQDSDEEVI